MANLELNKLIHKKHVTNNNKITKTIITDTMFIENKNNSKENCARPYPDRSGARLKMLQFQYLSSKQDALRGFSQTEELYHYCLIRPLYSWLCQFIFRIQHANLRTGSISTSLHRMAHLDFL